MTDINLANLDTMFQDNTKEFRAIRNAKEVTTEPQMVHYLAMYGCEHLPEALSNDPNVVEAARLIEQAMGLLAGKPSDLIQMRPQVEKMLDLNREQRIMLQKFRDVFK